MSAITEAVMGIDVGTGSARAGVFDLSGTLLGVATQKITTWRDEGEVVEQSSANIWDAVCFAARTARQEAGVAADAIVGIGFDATCSMVLVGQDDQPVAAGPSGNPERDIIVWMDHRATDQAKRINKAGDDVLQFVGGVISPEMQTPKLMWLKENLAESFEKTVNFFDLTDYLTWRATGSKARSSCTVSCKWTYLAHETKWSQSYFESIGLGELAEDHFARIGSEIVAPGTALGRGLNPHAARDLSLVAGTPVAAGLIDAHAGGVGTIGAKGGISSTPDLSTRVAFVFGTSNCTMSVAKEPRFVPGIWGPYYDAMTPDMWLNEGGQSAAGAAIDHIVSMHPAYDEARGLAKEADKPLLAFLEEQLMEEFGDASAAARAAFCVHVLPDILGNRSPLADPAARAIIMGIGAEHSIPNLTALYAATVCGLGYSAAQILEAQKEAGYEQNLIIMSGGAAKSPFVRQVLADTTGCAVALTEASEPVLLGSAMLGAVAAEKFGGVTTAMGNMSRLGHVQHPSLDESIKRLHAAKRQIFDEMTQLERASRARMAGL